MTEATLQASARRAARRLAAEKLSRRDIGHLLGVSHQRVQQLLNDTDTKQKT